MAKTIRIGTRDSELALWQAHTVQDQLNALGYKTELVSVKSTGDLILDKPLYELGITGIFTKTLDVAMINGSVDIAVHSMKDVPTQLPKGIVQGAVLPRAAQEDIFVFKGEKNTTAFEDATTIATGSLRRKAQWLHKYPKHSVVDLRGNVNTRLQKVEDNDWAGAIFAKAGLERINLKPENHIVLDWMIPAPAQGAMVVAVMDDDTFCKEACAKLNDKNAELATRIEREFLRTLEGGCTAPIGAYAAIKDDRIYFHGALFSLDGSNKMEIEESVPVSEQQNFGRLCALKILESGGRELMVEIKKEL
ncbi:MULTISPECIES: hydroxymethylbilane synthase [unclassified Leeuwenhoekiella]|uniref:hydroxymethylbilane synthase n=1 Tax=unclassified Leeuwenhoekiella TaxID=2615029 RepID=UPI000C5F1404|nr:MULTISPECIES: hydroxymethylbilane synthase [unclassified Leeuwenhoekiella]MAW96083.1 hydroxymethylbilane synthase [Leeuwenhoekiella sp.]MBA80077.1 hydroxymethylbilane synthase [Leeuwenhoekiella sp.]